MLLVFAALVAGLVLGILIARRYIPVQIEYVERKVPKSHVLMEKKELGERLWSAFMYGMETSDKAHYARASVRVHEQKRKVRMWNKAIIKSIQFDNGKCEFSEYVEDQAAEEQYDEAV